MTNVWVITWSIEKYRIEAEDVQEHVGNVFPSKEAATAAVIEGDEEEWVDLEDEGEYKPEVVYNDDNSVSINTNVGFLYQVVKRELLG